MDVKFDNVFGIVFFQKLVLKMKIINTYLYLKAEGGEGSQTGNPESVSFSRDYCNNIGRTFWIRCITNSTNIQAWRVQRRTIESSFSLYQK